MRDEKLFALTSERRDEMVAEIKKYFLHEREEELGDLAAGLILDFIQKELAPEFYNQGIEDSHRYMQDAAEDLLSIRK
ncbi:MAG: DUF2164 domain-containing protein [Methanomicrobiales archaeon HGW-Methanomicrobiales-1]|nr:MAG: DUF2164 domain-containing protein [Methanomicrobiales archaeon HGW-Methanomicrobiales-1]